MYYGAGLETRNLVGNRIYIYCVCLMGNGGEGWKLEQGLGLVGVVT